jgi:hypothetical protein
MRSCFTTEIHLALAGDGQQHARGQRQAVPSTQTLPPRPDTTILSEAIPLFYIGQNSYGLWIAREGSGCSGGLFLRRQSALQFARRKSEQASCAIMFLNEPFELDVANEGGRFAMTLAALANIAARRMPDLVNLIGAIFAESQKLVSRISRACAGARRNRAALERELFSGEVILTSKSDDDLPTFN